MAARIKRVSNISVKNLFLASFLLLVQAPGYAMDDLTSGLLSHWKFEENGADATGNGHEAVEFGSVAYIDGVDGKAAYLKTASDYFGIEQDILLSDFSISMYVNLETLASTVDGGIYPINTPFNGARSDLGNNELNISLVSHNNSSYIYLLSEDPPSAQSSPLDTTDKWVHYVVLRENGSLSTYVDG